MINNKFLIISVVVCSFVFCRTSTKHKVVVSPENITILRAGETYILARDCFDDESSLKWKRRHKRRKKTRRPQRGR